VVAICKLDVEINGSARLLPSNNCITTMLGRSLALPRRSPDSARLKNSSKIIRESGKVFDSEGLYINIGQTNRKEIGG